MPARASSLSSPRRRAPWAAGLLAALTLQHTGLAAHAEPAAAGLQLDQRRLAAIAGRPPAPGSAAEAADLAILEWLQRFRSPVIVATTWLLLDRDLNVFSSAVGAELGKATPVLSAGLVAFMAPVNSATREIKQQQGRIRPYLAHPHLDPCLPREDTGAFPSGHAVWFRTTAKLLADLVPERRERLEHVGRQGGANRVLCGVHYPSDVEAGQRIGADAALQIIASPQWRAFRQDPALQAELKRLRAVPAQALPPMMR
jgi:acid phosphatase (class A)